MTLGKKIIARQFGLIDIEEANRICRDLDQLNSTGVWKVPAWATELAKHYEIGEAHVVVQLAGWQAIAKAYQDVIRRVQDDSMT